MNVPQSIFFPQVQKKIEDELNPRELLFNYIFRYWYLYIFFAVLCIGTAYAYLKVATPVYEITGRLLIKEDKEKSSSPEDMLKDMMLFGTSENVINEMHILQSHSLMDKVVKQLNLEVTYYWKDWFKTIPSHNNFPIYIATYSLSPSVLQSDDYRLKEGLVLHIVPIDSTRFEVRVQDETVGTFHFDEYFTTKYGSFKIGRSPEFPYLEGAEMYINFKDPEVVTENYIKEAQIGLIDKESSIIELSLQEKMPQRAIEILNTLVDLYNEATIEDKNEVSINTLSFIDDRLVGISKDLSNVERNVEKYKKKNDISSTSEKDIEIILKEVSKYTETQTELEVQMNILQSMDVYLSPSKKYELIPANLSISNEAIKDLIGSYNKLILQRQRLLETATTSNPQVRSLEQQLKSLKQTIHSTTRNIKKDLQKKITSVSDVNGELMSRIKRVPSQERGLLEIKRQQLIKESLYLFLLKKKEETALTLAATTANARIIDEPRANRIPIAPKRPLLYLGSLLGAFFIPFLLILGKNILQDTIQNEEDIKQISKLPILGTINQGTKNQHIVVTKSARTAIAERFRLIRNNLQLTKKRGPQTILITSSVSGEGKSFIALNLALSFTLLKKKTLLLGMDLRKPKLQEYLEEDLKNIGITEYIVGLNTLEEVIQSTPALPYLDFIVSGTIPYNPNELLAEQKVANLFQNLQEQYEVIIIDTPPIGLVSDAFLLTEFTTNSIFVVRSNITKKQMIAKTTELLNKSKMNSPSILLNGVNDKGSYGYGGSYGYYEN